MNKNDRTTLCRIIASLEWGGGGGSSSEAAAMGRCARTLREAFPMADEDLHFAYAWEILQVATRAIPTDEDIDAILLLLEGEGYEAVTDFIESAGFDGLLCRIRQEPTS